MTLLTAALSPAQAGEMVLIGGVAGVLGGLLGIGGGLVMIPAMLLVLGDSYGVESLHLYTLASITTSFVLAVPAAIRHWRERAIVTDMLKGMIPAAAAAVIAGVWLASLFTGEQTALLRKAFGAFLILVTAFDGFQLLAGTRRIRAKSCPVPWRRGVQAMAVGAPSGLIAGLLGIAGGVWAVPAQHLGMGVNLRNAIANSTAMIVFVSLATSIAKSLAVARMEALQPADAWLLSAYLSPGALAGGWMGAALTHRLHVAWLRTAVDALLLVTGVRLVFW